MGIFRAHKSPPSSTTGIVHKCKPKEFFMIAEQLVSIKSSLILTATASFFHCAVLYSIWRISIRIFLPEVLVMWIDILKETEGRTGKKCRHRCSRMLRIILTGPYFLNPQGGVYSISRFGDRIITLGLIKRGWGGEGSAPFYYPNPPPSHQTTLCSYNL